MNNPLDHALFVWRRMSGGTEWVTPPLIETCPFCRIHVKKDPVPHARYDFVPICCRCGWHIEDDTWTDGGYIDPLFYNTCLYSFDINDPSLTFAELAAYLQRNPAHFQGMSWRSFEKFVANYYRGSGWDVILTSPSRDDGADVVLLKNGARHQIIECKKYADHRKIGVALVRQLAGAAIDFEVKNAVICSTSPFTTTAQQKVHSYRQKGFQFDLVRACDLVKELGIYNTHLPDLSVLDAETLRSIQTASREVSRQRSSDS